MDFDCFNVCTDCKWVREVSYFESPVCAKCERVEVFPEGKTETYYRITPKALEQFRSENNGRCPYFEEKFSFVKFIKSLFGRVNRTVSNKLNDRFVADMAKRGGR